MHTNEKRLAKRMKNSDTAALGEIIDLYTGYVRTVIRNFSRGTLSEQDIEELCADVFFSLWQHRNDIKSDVGFRSYLSAIARNAVKDRFRSAKPPSEDISELEIPCKIEVEDMAQLHETLRCLDEGLKTLPKNDCEIFARFYFYGESTPEIARRMALAESSVRSSLSRTRNKLKEYLMKRGFDYA